MQTIASRGAIIGQRVTARPSGKTANKSATRQPIKVNAVHTNQTGQGIMVDPDQYDPDANTGRGSGVVARAAGQQVRSSGAAFAPAGARPSRVVRAPDGVTYDPDQYDPDANQRSSGNVYSPPTGQLMADLTPPRAPARSPSPRSARARTSGPAPSSTSPLHSSGAKTTSASRDPVPANSTATAT